MCSLGLMVGVLCCGPTQPGPPARVVIVRLENGPVIASNGVQPFMSTGFQVEHRTHSQLEVPDAKSPETRQWRNRSATQGRAIRQPASPSPAGSVKGRDI